MNKRRFPVAASLIISSLLAALAGAQAAETSGSATSAAAPKGRSTLATADRQLSTEIVFGRATAPKPAAPIARGFIQ